MPGVERVRNACCFPGECHLDEDCGRGFEEFDSFVVERRGQEDLISSSELEAAPTKCCQARTRNNFNAPVLPRLLLRIDFYSLRGNITTHLSNIIYYCQDETPELLSDVYCHHLTPLKDLRLGAH